MAHLLDNRYRILRVLGSGGFGETFLAEDTKMPSLRCCVIKQLRAIADKPEIDRLMRDRFQREAAILERLGNSHPQIPCLYANFTEGDRFYLVQEWIEGQTLFETVRSRGYLNESAVWDVLVGILPVLSYVHEEGIIHRDIKPENMILRAGSQQPVLIDFGAVKETVTTVASRRSKSTIAIGTPGFMPSEQAAGRPLFASDIYSLGLTAIFALTGKLPQELGTDARTGELDWHAFAPHTSPEFAEILDRAVSLHPRDRFATATEMFEALQEIGMEPATIAVSPRHAAAYTLPATIYRPVTLGGGKRRAVLSGLFLGSMGAIAAVWGLVFNQNFAFFADKDIQPQPSPSVPQPPVRPAPRSFYFLADSAFREAGNAERQQKALQAAGNLASGVFKIAEYPNLPPSNLTQVYVAKYTEMSSCIARLKTYVQQKPDAFCALASTDPQAPDERIAGSEVAPALSVHTLSPTQSVRQYYELVNKGQYDKAWQSLSSAFRKSGARGYDAFVDWWYLVRLVTVKNINVITSDALTATVEAELVYSMMDGRESPQTLQISLVWDASAKNWLFNSTEVIK